MLNAAIYERTQIIVGDVGVRRLQRVNVFLAGVGGVGGHCAEALVRGGVGRITICDHDVVSSTNKNRQLVALDSTVGESKVSVLARRLQDINAHCQVTALDALLLPEDMEDILTRQRYDYVVDCIDSVECKVALLSTSVRLGLRTYAACGAGGRVDPSHISVGTYSTPSTTLSLDVVGRSSASAVLVRVLSPLCTVMSFPVRRYSLSDRRRVGVIVP
ncbi:putative ThiF family [Trypanosoma vivax]|nr:putative ThiF family [Trypanosoma vivax]